ncbi:MAG: DsbA family protein [Thiohalomonadales bacterium]
MNIKYKLLTIFFLTLVVLLTLNIVSASDQKESISAEEANAILQELKHIRSVLERIEKKTGNTIRAAAPSKPKVTQISSINRPSLGNKDAPVTIVEVSDYQCPFCKRFVDSTMKDLKKDFIDTGKVRIVFKDLPLPFHTKAKQAAQAAHCAGDQGKYWPMHDKLFANIKKYDESNFIKHAKALKLNTETFKSCLSSKRHLDAIEKDIADASKAGLTGTPSFVVGKTTKDIIKGTVIIGAQPISSLKLYIEKYL